MRALVCLIVFACLCGCATQPSAGIDASGAPGFFLALWHGFIAPLSMVGALLTWLAPEFDVRLYAWPNTGPVYDLGFFLGISAWGGGAYSRTSRRRRTRR